MKCPLCRSEMKSGHTSLPYELDEDHFILVRLVPALICSQCDEAFVDIKTVREVERIVGEAEKRGIVIGVIQYNEAA